VILSLSVDDSVTLAPVAAAHQFVRPFLLSLVHVNAAIGVNKKSFKLIWNLPLSTPIVRACVMLYARGPCHKKAFCEPCKFLIFIWHSVRNFLTQYKNEIYRNPRGQKG
jgi:hypothetical protein